jgi:hypothetical protein
MERQIIKNMEQTWNGFHLVFGVYKLSQSPVNCVLVRHNSILKGEFLKDCFATLHFSLLDLCFIL